MLTKVFVSSKQGELEAERAALKQALMSSEWDNFVFEFAGAYLDSARDVYLKQVAESDIYFGIFYKLYSQATIDEYHEARRLSKPCLIYLKRAKESERAVELNQFITSELQPAHKYQEFSTTKELVSHLPDVRRALQAEIQKHTRQAYLDALIVQTELLELAGIAETGERERPKLEQIFVPLSAAEEVEDPGERQGKGKRERESTIKITRRVTLDQALREHQHLLILGEPGSGKSTLLRYLTLVFAENQAEHYLHLPEQRLPIWIRLSSFAKSEQSLVPYFVTFAKEQLNVSLDERFFEQALNDGNCIVCLDGLDEVAQPEHRVAIRDAITTLALDGRFARNRFVVTARVAGYESAAFDKRAFAHHTLLPFGQDDIQAFVTNWYEAQETNHARAQAQAANLFNNIKENERLLKLADNPLMLTIIALVHQRSQGELPTKRATLYDRCTETLFENWDEFKGLEPEDRSAAYYVLRRRLCERAAFLMHPESQKPDAAAVRKDLFEQEVADFLSHDKTFQLSKDVARIQAKKFVKLVTSRTGVLREREDGTISFIHLTFQEYFVACDIYERYGEAHAQVWQIIHPHLYDAGWLEVILLLIGKLSIQVDVSSEIVGKIFNESDKFDTVLHRNLLLAARCLSDGVNVRESLRNEIIDALLDIGSGRGRRSWLPKLVFARGSSNTSLRVDAIRAVGMLNGDKRAGAGLLALAEDTADRIVQLEAVRALGQLGRTDDAVLRGLWALVQGNAYATLEAALTLGRLGRTDVVAPLLLALAQDEKVNAIQQVDLAKALGQLGRTDDAMHLLLALMRDENLDWIGKYEVARALGQLGRTDEVVIHALLVLVQDEKADAIVRIGAARGLGQLGRTDDVVPFLLTLVQDTQDAQGNVFLHDDAVRTLGQLGRTDQVVIHALTTVAQDRNSFARLTAAWALGQLGKKDLGVALPLLALTDDEDANMRNAAYNALKQVVGKWRYEEVVKQTNLRRRMKKGK